MASACATLGVAIDRHAVGGEAELHDVHAAADGRAELLLTQAVAAQDCGLALGCAAAVAAHGGHEEGLRAARAHFLHDSGDGFADAGDAATADADGDLHAWADGDGQGQLAQALADVRGDVGDVFGREFLAHRCNFGQIHVACVLFHCMSPVSRARRSL